MIATSVIALGLLGVATAQQSPDACAARCIKNWEGCNKYYGNKEHCIIELSQCVRHDVNPNGVFTLPTTCGNDGNKPTPPAASSTPAAGDACSSRCKKNYDNCMLHHGNMGDCIQSLSECVGYTVDSSKAPSLPIPCGSPAASGTSKAAAPTGTTTNVPKGTTAVAPVVPTSGASAFNVGSIELVMALAAIGAAALH